VDISRTSCPQDTGGVATDVVEVVVVATPDPLPPLLPPAAPCPCEDPSGCAHTAFGGHVMAVVGGLTAGQGVDGPQVTVVPSPAAKTRIVTPDGEVRLKRNV
jgi:hypothetical protein